MLNHLIHEKLRSMQLRGMAAALEEQERTSGQRGNMVSLDMFWVTLFLLRFGNSLLEWLIG